MGAGLAGLRTAEALRSKGYAGDIMIVGDEAWAPYNRPPLSKQALAGELSHESLVFRVRSTAIDLQWRHGETAVASDLAQRTVTLSHGEQISYDVLVAATGVSARRLALSGPPPTAAAGRHVLRTLDDAIALRADLTPGARLVVLGAGFIGCEVAATARQLGCEVHCVALDSAPMVRPLGGELAAELQRRHEAQGVVFHLGVGVVELLGEDRITGVVLSDGTRVEADVVLEALGSRCNVEWLEGNGLDLGDGVLADTALRPLRDGEPIDGVAVVGDLARFPYVRFDDQALRVEHWNIPTETGRRAGAVLAAYLSGHDDGEVAGEQWELLPAFWSDQYDVRLQSFGLPSLADADGVRLLAGRLDDECIVGYHRGADLMGVVGIGMLREVTALRDRIGRGRSGG